MTAPISGPNSAPKVSLAHCGGKASSALGVIASGFQAMRMKKLERIFHRLDVADIDDPQVPAPRS
jgi:hypothetical protein